MKDIAFMDVYETDCGLSHQAGNAVQISDPDQQTLKLRWPTRHPRRTLEPATDLIHGFASRPPPDNLYHGKHTEVRRLTVSSH